jgi:ribosomal protein S18 acetylase RimI-like enzyme
MADVSVRPARATDVEAAARAQLAAWAEDGVLPDQVLTAIAPGELAATWTEAVLRPPSAKHRVLVALEGELVVGVVATAPTDDPDGDPLREGAIVALSVAPAARHRGHGSRLLAAAVDTMRETGFETAYAWVPDEPGLAFLTKAGWAEDGARRTLDLDGSGTVLAEELRLVTDVRPVG